MIKKEEFLEKELNLTESTELVEQSEKPIEIVEDLVESEESTLHEDFSNARSNIYDIIDIGKDLLFNVSELAKRSDESRPYEVAADLLNKMVQAQKDLIEIHQRKKLAIGDKTKETGNPSQINIEGNAIFTGSTTELQKLLEKRRKEA